MIKKASLCFYLLFCLSVSYQVQGQAHYKIGLLQFVEHPSLNKVFKGFKDHLNSSPLKKRYQLEVKNAQGNLMVNTQIAQKFISGDYGLLVGISTLSAQSLTLKNKKTPVLFSPVSDPVAAKLVKSFENPGGIATGSSDMTPIDAQLKMMRLAQPGLKKIGVVFSSSEENSTSTVNRLKEKCSSQGIQLETVAIPDSASLSTAAQSLIYKNVEAFYVPNDNLVVSSIEALVQVASKSKIPVYASDSSSVERGAVAALGFDYYRLGQLIGEQAEKILLQGQSPKSLPVLSIPDSECKLYLNRAMLDKLGKNKLSQAFLQKVDYFI